MHRWLDNISVVGVVGELSFGAKTNSRMHRAYIVRKKADVIFGTRVSQIGLACAGHFRPGTRKMGIMKTFSEAKLDFVGQTGCLLDVVFCTVAALVGKVRNFSVAEGTRRANIWTFVWGALGFIYTASREIISSYSLSMSVVG